MNWENVMLTDSFRVCLQKDVLLRERNYSTYYLHALTHLPTHSLSTDTAEEYSLRAVESGKGTTLSHDLMRACIRTYIDAHTHVHPYRNDRSLPVVTGMVKIISNFPNIINK